MSRDDASEAEMVLRIALERFHPALLIPGLRDEIESAFSEVLDYCVESRGRITVPAEIERQA